jgi:hypothetical protein
MVFAPARSVFGRAAMRAAKLPTASAIRVPAIQMAAQLQQKRYSSSGVRDYTVRDALNEALGM